MCTSIVANGNKTVIGWNLDILDMKYRVVAENDKVYIAVYDPKEGWLPLFGANANGMQKFFADVAECVCSED